MTTPPPRPEAALTEALLTELGLAWATIPPSVFYDAVLKLVTAYTAQVRQAEREACAKEAEVRHQGDKPWCHACGTALATTLRQRRGG